MKKKNLKFNDQNGSAMLMAMVAIMAIVATGIYLMNSGKSHIEIRSRIKLISDVNRATSIIGSILLSPANCNANFYNQPTVGNPAILKVCPSGFNCGADLKPGTTYLQAGTSSWDPAITGLSDRIRVKSMSYSIVSPMVAPDKAAVLELKVEFEEKLDSHAITDIALRNVKTVTRIVQAFVVTSGLTITGCPRSPNTVTVYGP